MKRLTFILLTACMAACRVSAPEEAAASGQTRYFDRAGRNDTLSGGVRMIPITTPEGVFRVWTKRVGNNPKIKVLLLHGGPGATHEYFEAADSYLPGAGIEYYYYDQLGSAYSDQPRDTSLWDLPRFVEEVEQVRQALGLDRNNFYLLGHSWGGILATEYALKYQQHLKGLIISNMMMSSASYNEYAHNVLMPAMDPNVLKQVLAFEQKKDYENPKYMELLVPAYYTQHILRMPPDQWPDPRHRRYPRHDGTETHAVGVNTGQEWPVPAVPEWQPHGDVRRSRDVLRRIDPVSDIDSARSVPGAIIRACVSGVSPLLWPSASSRRPSLPPVRPNRGLRTIPRSTSTPASAPRTAATHSPAPFCRSACWPGVPSRFAPIHRAGPARCVRRRPAAISTTRRACAASA